MPWRRWPRQAAPEPAAPGAREGSGSGQRIAAGPPPPAQPVAPRGGARLPAPPLVIGVNEGREGAHAGRRVDASGTHCIHISETHRQDHIKESRFATHVWATSEAEQSICIQYDDLSCYHADRKLTTHLRVRL